MELGWTTLKMDFERGDLLEEVLIEPGVRTGGGGGWPGSPFAH